MPLSHLNLTAIQTAVATRLPKTYEPLTLTFYGLGTRQKGDVITFANDGFVDLCVNARDGRVYAKDQSNKIPDRFVNTGFEQFIAFFNAYVEHAKKIWNAEQAGISKDYWALVRAMRPALEAIDKDALGDINKYWEPAVEQIEEENQ